MEDALGSTKYMLFNYMLFNYMLAEKGNRELKLINCIA